MRKPIILATLVHFALRCALCSTLFTTQAHAGYRYRYQVTVDHTQAGSSDSASFPILVYISSNSDFKTAANGGYIKNTTTLNGQTVPADLIVTSDTTCAIKVTAWEVASYSGSSGTVELWVNQGTLSHTVNTVFYICIGNAAITTYQSTATSVWASSFVGVWHQANGSALSLNDSTINAHTGSITGAVSATTGEIDGGSSYSGVLHTNYIDVGSGNLAIVGTNSYTVQGWFKSSVLTSSSVQMLIGRGTESSNCTQPYYLYSSSSAFGIQRGNNSTYPAALSSATHSNNTWYLVVGTYDGSTLRMYVNGSADGTGSTSSSLTDPPGASTLIGNTLACYASNKPYPVNGTLDELRVMATNVSADWITAEYNMEKPSQAMVTLGSKVALGGPRGSQIMDLEDGILTKGLH
jgi:hypothetical protein